MAVVAAPSQAHRTEPTFTQDGFPHVLLPHPWAPLHASTAPQPPVAFAGSNRQRTQRPGPQTKPRSSITPAGHVLACSPISPPSRAHNREGKAEDSGLRGGRQEVGRGTSLRKVGRSFSPADPPQLAPRKQRRSAKRLAARLVPRASGPIRGGWAVGRRWLGAGLFSFLAANAWIGPAPRSHDGMSRARPG